MIFKKNNINVLKDLYLTEPITKKIDWEESFFDREGYELNAIEKAFHEVNDIPIKVEDRQTRRVPDNALKVQLQHWYTQIEDHPNLYIDHAHILHRLGYKGKAKEQLAEKAKQYPHLWRMVHMKPKYGADFAIDWVDESQAIEIFHFEIDCRDYDEFNNNLYRLEKFIESINWFEMGKKLIDRKSEWMHLNEYEQAVYKANFFKFNKIGIKYFEDDYLNKPYLFSYLKVID